LTVERETLKDFFGVVWLFPFNNQPAIFLASSTNLSQLWYEFFLILGRSAICFQSLNTYEYCLSYQYQCWLQESRWHD
jgi:hypothetical protein